MQLSRSRLSRHTRALFLASMSALFVEILCIRWVASEIPVLAYFKNFTLLSAFIGLGIGCLLAEHKRTWWVAGLWSLNLLVLLVAGAELLHLHDLVFPDPRIDQWGREQAKTWLHLLRNLALIFVILGAISMSFIGLGQAIGRLLKQGPPLKVYSVDIAGSLAGTLGFALFSAFHTPPILWLLTAAALLAYTGSLFGIVRRQALAPLLVLVGAAILVGFQPKFTQAMMRWSPYYRIAVMPVRPEGIPMGYTMAVNRDVFQHLLDLTPSTGKRAQSSPEANSIWYWVARPVQY
jgi:hypothetical protein